MAYVDVDLDIFEDDELISECKNRSRNSKFKEELLLELSDSINNESELYNIAKDMQAGKDVRDKLNNYIYQVTGIIL